jgi:hypothetical protein
VQGRALCAPRQARAQPSHYSPLPLPTPSTSPCPPSPPCSFSGDFPQYVYREFADTAKHCNGATCNATAVVAGPHMQLRCPEAGSGRGLELLHRLAHMALECVDRSGKRLRLVPYLGGVEVPAPSYPGSAPGPKLDSGGTAGLVIGLLAALAIIGALAYFVGYKRCYRERQARSFGKMEDEGPGAQPASKGEDGSISSEDLQDFKDPAPV